ncbi:hypothetical protein DCAR_0832440 [Daucus carota subsp. sativus]|uniref:Histidine-containing phosphotransfer protein n=1 Tax=Daucus carota subsp. sativus TaxID=79200 RepID=A0A175YP05_DAUCS|nr:hypothetical protein DCAR_0832440 [Daucus carota subsp. sativus]
MFFTDSDKILNDLTVALYQQPIDFRKLTEYTHQFKGSTSSIGAQRLRDGCDAFHNFSCEQNAEGCMRSLQQVKQEYLIVKEKLQNLITVCS